MLGQKIKTFLERLKRAKIEITGSRAERRAFWREHWKKMRKLDRKP